MKLIVTILFSLSMLTLGAHEIRPAYLQLTENADKSIDILWKQPVMGEYSLPLHPQISSGWMDDSTAAISYNETYLIKQWHVPSNHVALEGETITIRGLEKTITDALITIIYADGKTASY